MLDGLGPTGNQMYDWLWTKKEYSYII
jgi:hypothetical protein